MLGQPQPLKMALLLLKFRLQQTSGITRLITTTGGADYDVGQLKVHDEGEESIYSYSPGYDNESRSLQLGKPRLFGVTKLDTYLLFFVQTAVDQWSRFRCGNC